MSDQLFIPLSYVSGFMSLSSPLNMLEPQRPDVDLIITFRTTSSSKQPTREDSRKAEQQYKRLTETLSYAGLKSVGRRGESLGHLFVFVTCPPAHVDELVRRER
jgi:anoctamin-10